VKRLGIEDLTDEHLRLLVEAEKVSVVANARAWLEEVARGGPLELWECPGGIAGFRKEPGHFLNQAPCHLTLCRVACS